MLNIKQYQDNLYFFIRKYVIDKIILGMVEMKGERCASHVDDDCFLSPGPVLVGISVHFEDPPGSMIGFMAPIAFSSTRTRISSTKL